MLERFPDQPRVYAQHGFLAQRAQQPEVAEHDFARALEGSDWTPQEQRNLRLAWSDSAYAGKHPDAALQALAPLQDQPDPDIQIRLAHAAALAGAQADDPVRQRYARALFAQATNAGAAQDTAALPASDPRVIGQRALNEAYDHLRAHDDRAALDAFQRGFASGEGNWSHYADAAYAAKRLGDNPTAISLFRASLDRADRTDDGAGSGDPNASQPLPADRRFGYRREVEQMQRTWGAVLSSAYQASAFGLPTNSSILQGGAEVYWQPSGIGYQDGRILQFFVRGYDNLHDGSGAPSGRCRAEQRRLSTDPPQPHPKADQACPKHRREEGTPGEHTESGQREQQPVKHGPPKTAAVDQFWRQRDAGQHPRPFARSEPLDRHGARVVLREPERQHYEPNAILADLRNHGGRHQRRDRNKAWAEGTLGRYVASGARFTRHDAGSVHQTEKMRIGSVPVLCTLCSTFGSNVRQSPLCTSVTSPR
ncbi:hypothetical protein LMG10661_02170 [Ralstonia syzygii subsp. syzygii]|nr:hypothetical protein LMG10661_02170 [Ralstonia syzygii subsp. syzygii]